MYVLHSQDTLPECNGLLVPDFFLGLLTDSGFLSLLMSFTPPLVPSMSLAQRTSGWLFYLLLLPGRSEILLEMSFLQTGFSPVTLVSWKSAMCPMPCSQ